MCRIVGIQDFGGNDTRKDVLSMRDLLIRGGPDDAGLYTEGELSIGHRRLAIIDTSQAAHQPMSNDDSGLWITYNGEVYNFQSLRSELKNYRFKSNGDAEVVIKAYEKWGKEFVHKLVGMFALGIWESRKRKLLLVRDRFGIKPLYYGFKDRKFIFASEVKAFKQFGFKVNEKSLIQFLVFGYIPSPFTSLEGVFSLPPSTIMEVNNGNYKIEKYYEINFEPKIRSHENKIIENIRNILEETIKIHLISDVPIGVFLSGGLDSSSLVALASKFKKDLITISLIFDEPRYSERKYQLEVANKFATQHYEIKVNKEDFHKEFFNIFDAMDQPTIDGVNTFFISKSAKDVGLKTVISGLGGDEVFYGYRYFSLYKKIKKMISSNLFRDTFHFLGTILKGRASKLAFLNKNDLDLYLCMRSVFTPKEVAKLLDCKVREVYENLNFNLKLNHLTPEDEYAKLEFNFYLLSQLLKDTDFMSMYHSVEIRVPFLSHVLVDYVSKINPTLKLKNGVSKHLLRESLKDLFPPLIYQRKKMGFIFPMDDWIRAYSKDMIEIITSLDFLNKKFVLSLWHDFILRKIHWSKIWALIVLSQWVK